MSAKLLEGKVFAAQIKADAKKKVETLQADYKITPGLAVVIVGENAASKVYVANTHKACQELGIYSVVVEIPETTSKDELLDLWNKVLTDNHLKIKEKSKVEEIRQVNGFFEVYTSGNEKFSAQTVLLALGRRGSPRKLDIEGELDVIYGATG